MIYKVLRKAWSRLGALIWNTRTWCLKALAGTFFLLLRRRKVVQTKEVRAFYLHPFFPRRPSRSPIGGGGGVKYAWLESRFPHGFPDADVIYAVSSARHEISAKAFERARRCGLPIIWNQNGAYFPHSYGADAALKGNREMAHLFHTADYVLYQSEFALTSSTHFLGERAGPGEVLYNAVDTSVLRHMPERKDDGVVLLAAGSHDDSYRLPLVLNTFLEARQKIQDLRLIIAGRIAPVRLEELQQRIKSAGLQGLVEIAGPYSPRETPLLFNRAHIFLHAKYSDVCPSVVLEAMACGLPVAFSSTGGVPELVGDAGIGVWTKQDWDVPHPPPAEELAAAVANIASDLNAFSRRARERVVSRFDLQPWLARHEEVFREWMERIPR